MKCGVDCDGVVADVIPALLHYHNREYGTSYRKEDVKQYELYKTWGGTREEDLQKINAFFESIHSNDIKPVEGAVSAITHLSRGHELYVITARPVEILEHTIEWLGRYFPGKFKGIHLAGTYGSNGMKKKSDICSELGIEVIIEDSIHHAVECSKKGVAALLYDSPWNQVELDNGILRVHSWTDVLDELVF